MLGQVAVYRRQGKPRMRRLDSIMEATGLWLDALKETVQDRKKWRMLVEEKTRNRERIKNSGEGKGKPLLDSNSCLKNPL
jgi:hypothetical protein